MKYIITESRLEDIVTKYIHRTIGECRELRGEERYSPPPFATSLEYYAGFYKDGEYTAIMTHNTIVINVSYYEEIRRMFNIRTINQLDNILINYVNTYDLPFRITNVSAVRVRFG